MNNELKFPGSREYLPIICTGGQQRLWATVVEECCKDGSSEAVPPMVSQSYIVPNGPYRSFAESITIPSKRIAVSMGCVSLLLGVLSEGIRLGNKFDGSIERVLLTLMKSDGDEEVFFWTIDGVNDAIQIAVERLFVEKQEQN